MRYEQAGYKIYIGQTNSLQNRILNYISEFQPHAPNDYKLRVFEAFMIELLPGATLDLNFREVDCRGLEEREAKARLTAVEGEAIQKFDPLLNNLKRPTEEAREELKKAFGLYYRSAFESKLRT